jgi:hypothetical protein
MGIRFRSSPTLLLLAVLCGCSLHPNVRNSETFAESKPSIRRIAVMPPLMSLNEERVLYNLKPHKEWNQEAVETLGAALADEARRIGAEAVRVSEEEEVHDAR